MKTDDSNPATMTKRRTLFVLLGLASSVLIAAATACTAPVDSGDASSAKKTDASAAQDEGDPDLQVDAAETTCNALTVDGLSVGTVEGSTDPAPDATGGDLADGTYVFVKAIMYGLSDAIEAQPFLKSKIVLANDVAQTISQTTDGTNEEPALGTTEKYTPSDSKLTIATTCPSAVADEEAAYSVLDDGGKTQLVIYHSSEGGTIASFYDKQ